MEYTYKKGSIGVVKGRGVTEKFNPDKIISSCMNAGASSLLASKIVTEVEKKLYDGITTEEIRRIVIDYLSKTVPKVADTYSYSSRLMVRTSRTTMNRFDENIIVESLIKETGIDRELAKAVAHNVSKELMNLKVSYLTAPLIREIVNVKLIEMGLESTRARYTRLGMPVYDVTMLMEHRTKENANLQYNPETIHKLIADHTSKEYALINLLPVYLADAHMNGQIHIHDLDYFSTRPFCFSHDIRFFLKNGLKVDGTGTHTSIAGPANRPEVAFLHAAKVLAASQTNCAGGQGFSYFNTFMAPVIEGLDYKKVKQLAQMFVYELSQMYVARGGQTVFSSIDMDMHVPKILKDVPVIKLGGKTDDSTTYDDYEDEIKMLFNAFTDVYLEGDYIGKAFNFPKLEVQIYPDDMRTGKVDDLLLKVSQLSAKFGTPYYIINQPYMPDFACYQCCAFLMPLDSANDAEDIKEGTIRGGSMQVVSLNLPQIAYEAAGNDDRLFELIDDRLQKASEVMFLRKDIIEKNLRNDMLPFLSQSINGKGRRYLEPDKQSYTIGIIGMNEMVAAHTGYELHESDDAWAFGIKVMRYLSDKVAQIRKEKGLNFALARTPAESSAYRLAMIDKERYGEKAVVQGALDTKDSVYYTNSFHVRPSADVSLWKRLQIEGAFHPLTDGGAMSHIWLSENAPTPEILMDLTKKIALKTAIQYMAYTKDLTVCNECHQTFGGLRKTCPSCGTDNVQWWSRITGYYQNIDGWNKGKIAELKDRRRYNV